MVTKLLEVSQGQSLLFDDYRYFFYITNDWQLSAAEVVLEANDRCDQENLLAQLTGSVRALHAPVDNLVSNWAYMVMVSLAWNLRAYPRIVGDWLILRCLGSKMCLSPSPQTVLG